MIDRDKFYFHVFCITFWVLGISRFVFEELFPSLLGLALPLQLLGDVVILLLGIATLREKNDKILIGIFFGLGILSSVINKVPIIMWINGFRDYIPFLFCVPILRYFFESKRSYELRTSLDRQLKVFLIIQFPCIIEQFLRYGACDNVGGSLGDGASGIISMLIILISFYFISKNWDGDNYISSLWRNKLYIILMLPVFLNETKVSFIFLFFYFILLFPFNYRSLGKIIIATPFLILIVIGMFYLYNWANDSRYDVSSMDFLDEYLTGGENAEDILDLADNAMDYVDEAKDALIDEDWYYIDVPRVLKIPLLINALENSKGGLLLGAGIGHLKGGTTLEMTEFASENVPLIFGSRGAMHLFIMPLGLAGLIWTILWFKYVLAFSIRKNKMAFQIKLFLLFTILVCVLYSDAYRFLTMSAVYYYLSMNTIYSLDGKGKENGK